MNVIYVNGLDEERLALILTLFPLSNVFMFNRAYWMMRITTHTHTEKEREREHPQNSAHKQCIFILFTVMRET